MIHKYIVTIDRLCPKCCFRNRTKIVDTKPIEIAACGKCGDIFMYPDNITQKQMQELKKVVLDGLKQRGQDVIL